MSIHPLKDLSIRQRLTLAIVLTAITSSAAVLGALALSDQARWRDEVVRDTVSLTDMLGRSSAHALAAGDRAAAREAIDGLRWRRAVIAASLFNAGGDLVADYWRDREVPHDVIPAADGEVTRRGHVIVSRTVRSGGRRVGTIVVEAAPDTGRAAGTYAGMTAAAALLALLLGLGFRRFIATPVEQALIDAERELQRKHADLEGETTTRRHAEQALAASEDTLRRLAFFDQLTGLPNRALFKERLDNALRDGRNSGSSVGVMFIDVDRFKLINDSLGHSAGDVLLRDIASRIKATVRRSDTLARLGGDEFTVLLSTLADSSDVITVAEKIIRALSHPFRIAEQEWYATVSIGISLFPEDGTDSETLIKNADIAMYRAKDRGRDCYELYKPELHARAMQRVTLEKELRTALTRGEFILHYQPVVDFRTGSVEAVEALIRWRHPERGLVMPSEFISIAEETGLIVPIGRWVLLQACSDAVRLIAAAGRPLRMAVNLAARQFQQANLADLVVATLAESGLAPDLLELEITESSAMEDTEHTIEMLTRLRALGIRLSIDDFGTGYSSLGCLKHFPLSVLKIDRSFVKDLTTDSRNGALIQAIVAIGRALGVRIVAEGVETDEQRKVLGLHGCDGFQGFLFSAAVPLERALELVRAGGPAAAEQAMAGGIVDVN